MSEGDAQVALAIAAGVFGLMAVGGYRAPVANAHLKKAAYVWAGMFGMVAVYCAIAVVVLAL